MTQISDYLAYQKGKSDILKELRKWTLEQLDRQNPVYEKLRMKIIDMQKK